ncbi:MAG: 30S ribosomal protein S11 [Candidatus Doudnabacteria bacterium]
MSDEKDLTTSQEQEVKASQSTENTTPVEPEAPLGEVTAAEVSSKLKLSKKKRAKLKFPKGRIYITSTFNNTIISVTDPSGNVFAWGSAGRAGFKGSKKSTPYAGGKTMQDVMNRIKDRGMQEAEIFIKGMGVGREQAIRALIGSGLNITSIKDRTATPHGGVRKKKSRRV